MSASVVVVHQLPQNSASGIKSEDGRETFVYVVVLSEPDAADGARIARDAAGIPAIDAPLGSTGLTCLRKRSEPESGDDSGLNYRVTAEFGVNAQSNSGGGGGGEPWTSKDRIRRSVQNYQISKSKDKGTPPKVIQNSAFDAIAGGLVFDEFNPVRVVNRFRRFTDFDPDAAELCVGSINSESFTLNPQKGIVVVPAKKALLRSLTCDDALWPTTNTFYYDITFELEIEGDIPLEYYYVTNKGAFYLPGGVFADKKPYIKTSTIDGKVYAAAGEALLNNNGDLAGVSYNSDNYDLQFTRRLTKSWSAWV